MADPKSGLTYDEVDQLKKTLGDTASPLQYAIARLLIAPSGGSWVNTRKAGAVVLVIDRSRECKIIRLYDIKTWKVLFDEELYVGMNYEAPIPYFHTFEIDGGIVGFDFAHEKQAEQFWAKVQQMIPKTATAPSMTPIPLTRDSTQDLGKSAKGRLGGLMNFLGREEEVSVKASVISRPTNVKHLQHIGYDPEKGFQVENIPPEWKAFFKSAGIKPKDLKDAETAKAVMSTIEQFAADNPDVFSAPPPAPAAPGAPPAAGGRSAPPPPGRRGAPAPGGAAPPPPAAPGAPPPPVPAPAPAAPPAPSAGKAPPAPAAAPRGDLLADIRKGAQLKKISAEENERPPIKAPAGGAGAKGGGGGGGDLADQLRVLMANRREKTVQDLPSKDDDDEWD